MEYLDNLPQIQICPLGNSGELKFAVCYLRITTCSGCRILIQAIEENSPCQMAIYKHNTFDFSKETLQNIIEIPKLLQSHLISLQPLLDIVIVSIFWEIKRRNKLQKTEIIRLLYSKNFGCIASYT